MVETYFPILFNLLRGLDKAMTSELTDSANSVGLTVTELNFIWIIFSEGEPTVSRISELTLLDESTVTQVLTRLKKKKFVTSFKKPDDTRFSYIKLTDIGEEKRKLLMLNNEFTFLAYLQKELESPEGKENIKASIEFLKKVNLRYNGEEFVSWVYSLPEKIKKDLTEL
ncbi:MarR family protease production transcriptional regulator HPr [Bacillus mesophilus]|uniref:MarR family transcriptional regulator n=1 Tax=Bacillus mesophilus TaxID=1808955 RepID=A0A6M0Q7H4_9BACI|nr:MarR family transcriptional regulator [Bacillus mesophilus]MBM7660347.1 MarR family protease production transcriptional regulator HPr [Bacillus mesophilus]NEY71058.1 MarR family transcriptional regulator [Bacillus mesophilus]